MKIIKVLDLGNDELLVVGQNDAGEEVTAKGWVSAMNHHYSEDDYLTEPLTIQVEVPEEEARKDGEPHLATYEPGMLKPGANPRKMSATAQKEYWLSLLEAASPEPKVLFGDKT